MIFTVEDEGTQMNEEMRAALSDRSDAAGTSARQRGAGLGLAIVRSFVHLHGGTVEARSEGPGRGSEFVVRLPVVVTDTTEEAPRRRAGEARRPRRVAVVDDNEDSADGLAMLLRLDGHEVETAHDGLEAVALAERFRPEVVFLDIGLPGISGYEAARRIRALPGGAQIRLVALTGWGKQEDRRKSAEAGFDRHLVKPVDPDELQGALDAGLPAEGSALAR